MQTVVSFSGEPYAVFPILYILPSVQVALDLEFSTDQRNELLLYTGHSDEDTRFSLTGMEIIDGLASLQVSYGGELYVLSVSKRHEISAIISGTHYILHPIYCHYER